MPSQPAGMRPEERHPEAHVECRGDALMRQTVNPRIHSSLSPADGELTSSLRKFCGLCFIVVWRSFSAIFRYLFCQFALFLPFVTNTPQKCQQYHAVL